MLHDEEENGAHFGANSTSKRTTTKGTTSTLANSITQTCTYYFFFRSCPAALPLQNDQCTRQPPTSLRG